MSTRAEENYLKAIYKLSEMAKPKHDRESATVPTNAIAQEMHTSAASVTDMIQRLSDKHLVDYEKYRGVSLTETGRNLAIQLLRRHRLWEVLLVEKLGFAWNEVHDLAEELEHVESPELTDRLDTFLGSPKFDPHGDPIPNAEGKFTLRQQVPLTDLLPETLAVVVGVREHSSPFLNHLDEIGVAIHKEICVRERFSYDDSMRVDIDGELRTISGKVARNILVKPKPVMK
ncbi:MAG TPA: metal-dependent transcriptional regulator [Saprospiraceae bacterium]|nr:metal-dependent transcriptional regulator [Saprospiraceae bacterium]